MTCQSCDTHFAIWQFHMTILESHATIDVTLFETLIRMHHDMSWWWLLSCKFLPLHFSEGKLFLKSLFFDISPNFEKEGFCPFDPEVCSFRMPQIPCIKEAINGSILWVCYDVRKHGRSCEYSEYSLHTKFRSRSILRRRSRRSEALWSRNQPGWWNGPRGTVRYSTNWG